jgi:DNA-binding transcriptional regulator YdaS (Cro superfamily)
MGNKTKGLQRAFEIFKCNASELARQIGGDCVRQNVQYWLKENKPPAEYCLKINEVSGVPLHELRPDVYTRNCKA